MSYTSQCTLANSSHPPFRISSTSCTSQVIEEVTKTYSGSHKMTMLPRNVPVAMQARKGLIPGACIRCDLRAGFCALAFLRCSMSWQAYFPLSSPSSAAKSSYRGVHHTSMNALATTSVESRILIGDSDEYRLLSPGLLLKIKI